MSPIRRHLLTTLILLTPVPGWAQGIISTVAGTGTSGFSGDGGPATAAMIGGSVYTLGVAVDSSGNLLILDELNNRIRKVDSSGVITTIAGGGTQFNVDNIPATSAELFMTSVFTDSAGNIYPVLGNYIRKIDTHGVITTIAIASSSQYAGDGLNVLPGTGVGFNASSAAMDPSGNIYLADSSNNRIRKIDTHGIITTYAGTGVQGFSGDGGPAASAKLGLPLGISADNKGNIYFGEAINQRVRKVDTNGIITTVAGNGGANPLGENVPATSVSVSPAWVGVDKSGNLYIADGANQRISQVNTAGMITTLAGGNGAGFSGDGGPGIKAQINSPTCVVPDSAGNVYFSDNFNFRIRKVTVAAGLSSTPSSLSFIATAGGASPVSQTINISGSTTAPVTASASSQGNWLSVSPASIAATPATFTISVSPTGLTATTYSGSITIASPGAAGSPLNIPVTLTVAPASAGPGVISTVAGNGFSAPSTGDGGPATSATFGPDSLAFDSAGNYYIGDYLNQTVRKVTPGGTISTFAGNGTYTLSGDGGPAINASLDLPLGLAADSAGNIYIADTSHARVRVVNAVGVINNFAGSNNNTATYGDGGPATGAYILSPSGVAVDTQGNVYIADSAGNRIRKVNPAGIISTISGGTVNLSGGDGGPASAAGIELPYGIATDSANNIYFIDEGNSRVRKINTAGIITTVAGNGTRGFSGDGGPATSAEVSFTAHAGIAVDTAGNLYFTDGNNNRVRKVDLSGNITTVAGNGTAAFSGDGGSPTAASLNNPTDVAFDSAGNLYIADQKNNRIRKITFGGGGGLGGTPSISSVVNGASFANGLVSNSWATITGTNLSSVTDTWANSIVNGNLPTTLDGVRVTVGGAPAYIYYVSPTQINFLVPPVSSGSVQLTVTTAGGTSSSFTATVSSLAPAFFSWPNNQVVATRQDYTLAAKNGTFGSPTTPAAPGDVLILWGTGFGVTSPPITAGVQLPVLPGGQTYNTAQAVTVTINGVAATVYGAAAATGFAGLYQIAIQVPASVGNGDWPLVASIGGVSSGSLTLSVHN